MTTLYEKFDNISERLKLSVQLMICGVNDNFEVGSMPDLAHMVFFILLSIKMLAIDIPWVLVLLPLYWWHLVFFTWNMFYILWGAVQMFYYYTLIKIGEIVR